MVEADHSTPEATEDPIWICAYRALIQTKGEKYARKYLKDQELTNEEIDEVLSQINHGLPHSLITLWLKAKRKQPRINIEKDPYCIGYWAQVAGFAKPVGTGETFKKAQDGWLEAKKYGQAPK